MTGAATSYRHTVIGEMGSGRDFKAAQEETLTRIAELGEEHRDIIDGPVTVTLATPPPRRAVATESIDELGASTSAGIPTPSASRGRCGCSTTSGPNQVVTFGSP